MRRAAAALKANDRILYKGADGVMHPATVLAEPEALGAMVAVPADTGGEKPTTLYFGPGRKVEVTA